MSDKQDGLAWSDLKDDGGTNYVPVKPDLVFPRRVPTTETLAKGAPDIHVTIEWSWSDKRIGYVRKLITLDSPDGISVTDVHALARSSVLELRDPPTPYVLGTEDGCCPRLRISRDYLTALGSARPSNASRLWVARVYAWARAVGRNPAQTVQQYFGLEARTATRWIQNARMYGLLDEDEGE